MGQAIIENKLFIIYLHTDCDCSGTGAGPGLAGFGRVGLGLAGLAGAGLELAFRARLVPVRARRGTSGEFGASAEAA